MRFSQGGHRGGQGLARGDGVTIGGRKARGTAAQVGWPERSRVGLQGRGDGQRDGE